MDRSLMAPKNLQGNLFIFPHLPCLIHHLESFFSDFDASGHGVSRSDLETGCVPFESLVAFWILTKISK